MRWFSKTKEEKIKEGQTKAKHFNELLSAELNTYCMDKYGSVYVFKEVEYSIQNQKIQFLLYNVNTNKGKVSYFSLGDIYDPINWIRDGRRRFLKLKDTLNHFGFEITEIKK